VELEVLKKDLSELIDILHIAERLTVKQVIQMDIELTLVKTGSLKNIFKEQFETKVSWTKVAMKHKKIQPQ
jgi:predicted transcriptional regulator